MKHIFSSLLALVLAGSVASAFGSREHFAITVIAENHLSPKAKAAIRQITGGERLSLYASFPDKFRPFFLYNGNTIPHTYHVDALMQPETDISVSTLGGIKLAADRLKTYKTLDNPDSAVLYLAYLVHYVGDMHCPSHIKYPKDTTPASPKNFKFEKNILKFHKAWDSGFSTIAFPGGPAEIAFLADIALPKQIKEYQKGGPVDWATDNAKFCFEFTRDAEFDSNGCAEIDMFYVQKHAEYAKIQIMKAGYRLAALLNQIFK